MARIDIQSFAKMGAEARLRQLDQERAEILSAFPELGGRATGRGRGRRAAAAGASDAPVARKRRRRRPPMTAAQKKEVSERMKRYWAQRRAAKKGK